MTNNDQELITRAETVLRMYKNDQFDNFKDPILEFQDLLEKIPNKEQEIRTELQKALDEAVTILKKDMKRDRQLAAWAKDMGLVK